MSLMLPGNLSGGGSIPRTMSSGDSTTPYNKDLDHAKIDDALAPGMIAVPQPGEASQMDGQLQDTSGPETIAAKMLRKNRPPDHFDEEGAELGKEARFWKVYVEESDRWDAEVIDSWNKSLDVILVFAALFSAISTAFLIETSKKLQPDPADTSAQSLLLITQTLLAMANNIPPPGLDVLSPNGTDTFTPTRNAIVINTLWYLSLSISLATAFIAALAKEWCQSFLAGRTGHPCIQARRRQQKWSMIETWRMEELITLLPTLIHVSLLFFSVGLCFYVQELNAAVAIPVVCVTGVAIGFYACSSLAASFIEFFPYKTIVSKMFGSTIVRPWITVARVLVDFTLLFLILLMIFILMVAGVLLSFCGPTVTSQIQRAMNYLGRIPLFYHPEKKHGESPKHDHVTSKALSWMVKYCEVPSSIDITLQAIAGATQGLPLQPLQDCQAALKISQRLVSGSLYKDTEEQQRQMRLYLRALAVLTTTKPQLGSTIASATSSSITDVEHLKALIWELQSQNEYSVASLMADTQFVPSDYHISALSIGSKAASQCLETLGNSYSDNKAVMTPFVLLFQQHFEKMRTCQTHPASIMALLNTGSLLSASSVTFSDITLLSNTCIQKFCDQFLPTIGGTPPEPRNEFEVQMPGAFIACCLLQNKHAVIRHHNLKDVLPVLISLRALALPDLRRFLAFGLLEIVSNLESYEIDPSQIPNFALAQERARLGSADISPVNYSYPINSDHFDVLQSLQTLRSVYALAQVGLPSAWAYVYVVGSMSRVRSRRVSTSILDDITDHCGYLLSKFGFPKLSEELIDSLEKRKICVILKRKIASKSSSRIKHFFAISQLWLLCTLYFDPISYKDNDPAPLLVRLITCFAVHDDSELEQIKYDLGEQIEVFSQNLSPEDSGLGSFEAYYYRVLECVFQSKDIPISDPRWEHIKQKLAGIPPFLRGLGSFIQLPMRSPLVGAPSPPGHAVVDVPNKEESKAPVDPEAISPPPELHINPLNN